MSINIELVGNLIILKFVRDRFSGLWNAQLARYHRGLAIFFAEQEIHGAECDRRHRLNLGAEDGLCPCVFQEEDRASDRERANQSASE